MKGIQTITSFDTKTGKEAFETRPVQMLAEADLPKQIESNVLGIYLEYRFQVFDGFGCAMTETSCYLLSRMEPEVRKAALSCWFGPEGMNASFVRIPIDSCDYSLSEYQAVADPIADPELKTFHIDRDRKYILPVMKEAMELAGRPISVLLSPWSPPADWKTPPELTQNDAAVYGGMGMEVDITKAGRCFGGRLKKEYYGPWAKYLVKFIQAYLAEGIPVTMLSVQNEANAATSWDSCVWSGEQERTFLKDYLYPEMQAAGLTERVKLYIWDHNKERMIEHIDEMMAGGIGDLIDGFAYHWYTGDHFDALSMLHERYPDKVLMHSESCGLHIPGKVYAFEPKDAVPTDGPTPLEVDFQDAENYAHDIIGNLNHGMNRFIDWNMIVDRTGGPRHVIGGFAAPLVAEEDGSWSKTISYHYLEQIASVVHPGAVRLGRSVYRQEVEAAAMRNPDGSIGIVLLNRQKEELPVVIRMQGTLAEITLPAQTLSTILLEK